jgi:hypothetical protein
VALYKKIKKLYKNNKIIQFYFLPDGHQKNTKKNYNIPHLLV